MSHVLAFFTWSQVFWYLVILSPCIVGALVIATVEYREHRDRNRRRQLGLSDEDSDR
jgi:hypothetical protein